MAAPSYNTYAFAAYRGKYTFNKAKVRTAGAGAVFRAGVQTVVWVFPALTQTEWDMWQAIYTIGGSMAWELWEDDTRRTSVNFTGGYLQPPEYEFTQGRYYRNVKITITGLTPLQA